MPIVGRPPYLNQSSYQSLSPNAGKARLQNRTWSFRLIRLLWKKWDLITNISNWWLNITRIINQKQSHVLVTIFKLITLPYLFHKIYPLFILVFFIKFVLFCFGHNEIYLFWCSLRLPFGVLTLLLLSFLLLLVFVFFYFVVDSTYLFYL